MPALHPEGWHLRRESGLETTVSGDWAAAGGDHLLNDRPVVYLGPRPSRRAINIQLGHSATTMRHPGYRKLVRNAILRSAGRLQ